MTLPKVQTLKRGGSRFYVEPETQEKVPGVTSILSMLPKPFLQFWGQKLVAEFAVDNFGAYSQLIMNGQRQAAIDLLKGAPRRFTMERADIGTEAHGLFEMMGRGEDIGRITPEMHDYVEHFQQWLDDFQPDFLLQEETVWSDKYRYAGSFDAIAVVGGETVIIDYKTSKSAYPDTALQLAAYKNADHIIRPDGSRVPVPKITAGAVLHITPNGYEFIPYEIGDEVFETFLALRYQVFEWDAVLSKNVKGRPLAPLFS